MSLTIVRDCATIDREIDTSLEDSGPAGITVNTNPSRGGTAVA